MEREGNDCVVGDTSLTASPFDGEASILSSTLLLDHVGEVTLTFHSDRLSWKLVEPLDNVSPIGLHLKGLCTCLACLLILSNGVAMDD